AGFLRSELFPGPIAVKGEGLVDGSVTIGIRPENIHVSTHAVQGSVPAELRRKSIQIGGQYLLALEVPGTDTTLKAKVAPSIGERLPSSGPVHVELPLDRVAVFDEGGN